MRLAFLYTPWKQYTSGFMMFSRGIKNSDIKCAKEQNSENNINQYIRINNGKVADNFQKTVKLKQIHD